MSESYDLPQAPVARIIGGGAAGYSLRRVPLPGVAVGGVLCGALTAIGAVSARDLGDLLQFLRLDVVLLAVVATLALDDPASPLTGATSVPRRRQRLWATVIIGTATLAAFAAIVVVRGGVIGPLDRVPLVSLATQLLALTAIGWLIAALVANVTGTDTPGRQAAALLVMVSIVSATTPWVSDRLWSAQADSWDDISVTWCLIAGIALLCVSWASPDRRR